ncbi:MAG: hypothetical protein WCA56_14870, partial [Xanthobacteraceae bacterium]
AMCIALMSLSVLWIGYSSCEEPSIKSGESSQTTQPDKNNCVSPGAVFKVGLNELWTFTHDHHEEVIAVGTAFIAIFTIVLGLFTVSVAAATNKLVEGAERAEKRELRAYVGVEKLAFECPGIKDHHYKPTDLITPGLIHKNYIVVTVRNFGQTPAYDVTVYAYFVPAKFAERLPDEFFEKNDEDIISMAETRPTLARFLLHKDQSEISKSALTDITPLKDAVAKKTQIYVFGRIYYRDIYDRPWRTKFCYSWEPTHSSGERFVAYETYNDEDQKELQEWHKDHSRPS